MSDTDRLIFSDPAVRRRTYLAAMASVIREAHDEDPVTALRNAGFSVEALDEFLFFGQWSN